MDKIYQTLCNIFPHYKINKNKLKKKIFYLIFSVFRPFIKGPFKVNLGSFYFYCYPQKKDYSNYILKRFEMPDPGELDLINSLLKKDSTFIDCGANAGFYAIPIASKNKFCKVFSFEPSNIEFEKLKKNLKINNIKNVYINKIAISDVNKKLIFREEGKNKENYATGNGKIILNKKKIDKNLDYEVQATTIDSFFLKKKISKNIIMKFDLEGHDINGIYGAKKIIKKFKPIILFEFSKMILNNHTYKKKDFEKFINENNLKIIDIYKKIYTVNKLHKKIKQLDSSHQTIGNYLLIDKKSSIINLC